MVNMARIPQGILGGLRGRIGNVIGASWKGINYIRSMPLSVANPNTTAQQAQRGAFTQTVLVARLLLSELIATFWDPFARYMSGYNHFIQINIDAFATAGLDVPADFSSARGILTGVDTYAGSGSEGTGLITPTWVDNSGQGDALATDNMFLVWYNETQDYWEMSVATGITRDLETYTRTDSVMVENDVMHVWGFFGRPDLEKISDSAYATFTCAA